MWLTGFDAPSLHTMYVDKQMRGHGLMQAIARVNRVFKDKPGGLVVDYLGLANELKQALATYTESGGKGRTAVHQDEAAALMQEKYEVCCGLAGRAPRPPHPGRRPPGALAEHRSGCMITASEVSKKPGAVHWEVGEPRAIGPCTHQRHAPVRLPLESSRTRAPSANSRRTHHG